jgi:bisphosphoglycerate-independent phosphoglycerate mutase (AlkP superfamily)
LLENITASNTKEILAFNKKLLELSIGEVISISSSTRILDFNAKEETLKKISRLIYLGEGRKYFSLKEALAKIDSKREYFLSIQNRGLTNPLISDFDSLFFCNYFYLNLENFTNRLLLREAKAFRRKPKLVDFHSFLKPPFSTYQEVKNVFQKPPFSSLKSTVSGKGLKTALLTSIENAQKVKTFFGKNTEFDKQILFNEKNIFADKSYPDIFRKQFKKLLESSDLVFVDLPQIEQAAVSGNYRQTIAEIKKVDKILGTLTDIHENTTVIVSSLYGLAEKMADIKLTANNRPTTSTNPLPFIIVGKEYEKKTKAAPSIAHLVSANKSIMSIAPTILKILEIDKPKEFSENSLV